MRIRLCKSGAAGEAAEPAEAAALAEVAQFGVVARIAVVSRIVVAPGIAEERSFEGEWLLVVLALTMAVATVIQVIKIAVEAATMVEAACTVAAQW
jgi:hypothetical protein